MSAGELEHEWAGTPGRLIRCAANLDASTSCRPQAKQVHGPDLGSSVCIPWALASQCRPSSAAVSSSAGAGLGAVLDMTASANCFGLLQGAVPEGCRAVAGARQAQLPAHQRPGRGAGALREHAGHRQQPGALPPRSRNLVCRHQRQSAALSCDPASSVTHVLTTCHGCEGRFACFLSTEFCRHAHEHRG